MKSTIRIGAGAGYSGDRIDPAIKLAQKGHLDYLVFECLAERTIALAQQQKLTDNRLGYDPLLEARMKACLPVCLEQGITIITNMGAANPVAAMHKTLEIAQDLHLKNVKVAAVTGDDVLEAIRDADVEILETGAPLYTITSKLISANAYLGANPIVEAIRNGANVIITGRTADPALFIAPAIAHFGWNFNDYPLLGKATVMGHLMECAGQLTGGYFADPGFKEVPGLQDLGFPIAEVGKDGSFLVTKLPDAGGMVTLATCKEQLLYEIHDPANYFTPDVVADFSDVTMKVLEKDVVQINGGNGKPKTGFLKVSVGFDGGYIGEGQISYGGSGAVDRGKLALEILKFRLEKAVPAYEEIRFDLIGLNALHGDQISREIPYEVRIRCTGKTFDKATAINLGNEVEALYTNGPAGGGGATKSVTPVIGIYSVLIPEAMVHPKIHYETIMP